MSRVAFIYLLMCLGSGQLTAASAGSTVGWVERAHAGASTTGQAIGGHQAPADSQEIHKRARSRQQRFEWYRQNRLPWGWDHSSGRCDERVGRFCLWHDDGSDDDEEPIPEPAEVRKARDELIAELGRAMEQLPGDEWIAGQRVRYLVEAGRHDEAHAAAAQCRAGQGWWCSGLAGYSLHAGGDFGAADSAFAEALRAMPVEERCHWTDITLFLDGDVKRAYKRLPCAARDSLEARFWWLAHPFYLRPANDRRTEHYSRSVVDRMIYRASSPFGIPWGSDVQEIVVRYGWPTHWEKVRARSSLQHRESILSHHASEGRRFLPPSRVLEDPSSIGLDDWPIDLEAARTEYAPAYASRVDSLVHQVSIFRRGDSAVVVAAYDMHGSEGWSVAPVQAALFLGRGERSAPSFARHTTREGKGVLSTTIASGPTLLSLELLSERGGPAARARYGIPLRKIPSLVLAVSSLMILEESDSLPNALSDAIPLAQGTPLVRAGAKLRFYWEVYGFDPDGEVLTMSLSLIKTGKGWLRRVGESVGLARRERPFRLEWQEGPPVGTDIWARSMALELPALMAGVYALELEVSAFGREPVRAARTIFVEGYQRTTRR